MIYGYARVSTAAQDESGTGRPTQGGGAKKVFRQKITGTTADRPQLAKLMEKLAPGDVVITPAVRTACRATQPTFWLSRATCSTPGPVSGHWPSRSSIPRPTSPRSSSPSLAWRRSSTWRLFRTHRARPGRREGEGGVKFGRKPTLTPHQQKEAANASTQARRSAVWPARSYNVSQSTISRVTA